MRSPKLDTANQDFAALAQGEDVRSVIPVLHGPPASISQLKMRPEILWSDRPSKLSERLSRAGQAIVAWGLADSPEWLGKLLFHLDQHRPCRRLEATWAEPPTEGRADPHRQSLLNLVEAIFVRAGCPGLRCRHTEDHTHRFGYQEKDGEPVRVCGSFTVFDCSGTLWLHFARGALRNQIYEYFGSLCAWGDPESKWTERLWRAAVLESAWSEIPDE